jgi:hypothetical protein
MMTNIELLLKLADMIEKGKCGDLWDINDVSEEDHARLPTLLRTLAEPQTAPKTIDDAAGKVERIARMMRKCLPHIPFCDPDIKDLEQAAATLRSLSLSRPHEGGRS